MRNLVEGSVTVSLDNIAWDVVVPVVISTVKEILVISLAGALVHEILLVIEKYNVFPYKLH